MSAGLNPVYPFDLPRSYNLMPPFYSSDGFEENPASTLALACRNPISTETGKLGLKFGMGLSLNTDGELEAGNGATLAEIPLKNENGRIKLQYSSPLTVSADNLNISIGAGLKVGQNGELENTNPAPFAFNAPLQSSNSTVQLNYQAPFKTDNNKLALQYDSFFAVSPSGDLTMAAPFPPLTNTGGSLGLSLSGPMTINNSKLDIQVSDPIQISNNRVGINLDDPLALNQGKLSLSTSGALHVEQGKLILKAAHPFSSNTAELELKLGDGLGLDSNNALYVTALQQPGNFTISPPLNISNNTLSIDLQSPLTINNSELAVQTVSPLSTSQAGLELNFNSPLIVKNNKLDIQTSAPLTSSTTGLALDINSPLTIKNSKLDIQTLAPITINNDSLSLAINAPLSVQNGNLNLNVLSPLSIENSALRLGIGMGLIGAIDTIRVNTGAGLTINNNAVDIKYGKGMEIDASTNNLQPKIGTGLVFDNDSIAIDPNYQNQDYTLWTTQDPSPNADIGSFKTAKLWLTLTRAGDIVLGVVSIKGLAAPATTIGPSHNIRLAFDNSGSLVDFASNFSGTWGFKKGISVDPSSPLDPKKLMPNSVIYPRNQSDAHNTIIQQCQIGDINGELKIGLNYANTNGYSLDFTWSVSSQQPFNASIVNFSYTPEL